MVRALIVILLSALPFVASSQDVVKVNILEIAGTIPSPPSDVKDAYSRTAVEKEDPTGGTRNADAFYKPIMDRIDGVSQQIGKAIEVLSKPQMDVAKEIDQKEMQKKFKSMSQEEQMKFAMEMSKKMGMGPKVMARESNAVIDAQQECTKVTQAAGVDVQSYQANNAAHEQVIKDRDAKHAEIQTWQEDQVSKLPQISYGEMSGPEPKAEYAVLTKAMEKHLAAENEFLKRVQKEWKTAWDKYSARYAPLQEKLAKIHYGEDAKNPETRRQLLSGQQMMVSGTAELVALSRNATDDAAQWWQKKLELEKNKPQH
jgi:hypothetical protein